MKGWMGRVQPMSADNYMFKVKNRNIETLEQGVKYIQI